MKLQPIDPKDIRVGDVVDYQHFTAQGAVRTTDRFTVTYVTDGRVYYGEMGTAWWMWKAAAGAIDESWFLVKRPQPKLGSRWVDPETGAGYVVAGLSADPVGIYKLYTGTPGIASPLYPSINSDVIARLIPRREWKARKASGGES